MKIFRIALLLAAGCLLATAQEKITPTIFWSKPAPVRNPAPLTSEQLSATANVPGTFVYDPSAGSVLPVGNDQTLSVSFTPTDTNTYAETTASVTVNVVPTYWPYDPSEVAYVCHVNSDLTPIIDQSIGQPRCFIVPVPVSVAITKWMLKQTEGLNPDGSVKYKYSSWWDYIVKHFIDSVVLPRLEEFPPPEVEQAKENAKAAARAVDAAKAAVLGVPVH